MADRIGHVASARAHAIEKDTCWQTPHFRILATVIAEMQKISSRLLSGGDEV